MRDVLLAFARRMAKALAAVTLMAAVTLAAHGKGALLGALLVGYFVAAVWAWSLGYRLWRMAGMTASGARRQMLWGLALRLAALFFALLAAARISREVFGAAAAGFLLFYALALGCWILGSRER